jgi:hypothetical protein
MTDSLDLSIRRVGAGVMLGLLLLAAVVAAAVVAGAL